MRWEVHTGQRASSRAEMRRLDQEREKRDLLQNAFALAPSHGLPTAWSRPVPAIVRDSVAVRQTSCFAALLYGI
ncbi:hypothetical protein VTN02DRAFT_6477 [Thermoascus thermophilus]